MSRFTFQAAAVAAGLALTLGAAAPAAATAPQAPAGTTLEQLYSPPAASIPGAPGSVVWWQTMAPSDPANVTSAAIARRVIFRSIAIDGTPNVQSATVFVPAGSAPAGGWKVVAWNHVTTGGADRCAPSLATPNLPGTTTPNPEFERLTRSDDLIDNLLERGLVVVRTDYEGLGTPGPHPYLIGESLARSSTDGVRAARNLIPNTSNQYAAAGHSEGGIAALSTSKFSSQFAPELDLKATLAATPPVDVKTLVFEGGSILPFATPLSGMSTLMLQGARLKVPALAAATDEQLFTPAGAALVGDHEKMCLAEAGSGSSLGGLSYSELYAPTAGAFKPALYAELDRNDPRYIQLGDEPIRFYAGALDGVAWQSLINKAVDAQRAAGADVSYKTYVFGTHPNITDDFIGGIDMANWLRDRLN